MLTDALCRAIAPLWLIELSDRPPSQGIIITSVDDIEGGSGRLYGYS
ncbi:MAG: hypothetical protein F6K19_46270 [Cyanothece sp. SIO1E1]|nr:hypothetical protein [Cyanothece sp. SIO1E1]